ncbi:unnamed protein product, partial [Rhizoctonia solani]
MVSLANTTSDLSQQKTWAALMVKPASSQVLMSCANAYCTQRPAESSGKHPISSYLPLSASGRESRQSLIFFKTPGHLRNKSWSWSHSFSCLLRAPLRGPVFFLSSVPLLCPPPLTCCHRTPLPPYR